MDGLLTAVRHATGRPDAAITGVEIADPGHRVENMTTDSLHVVTAHLDDGASCRLFAKTLHHACHSPMWHEIPEPFRAATAAALNWLDEPTVYRSGISADMPNDVRLPVVHHVEGGPAPDEPPTTADDDRRLTLWLEHVDDHAAWDLARYHRSAAALAGMSARWPEPRLASVGLSRREIDSLFYGKIVNHDLQVLAADEHWKRPEVAAVLTADPALRADIFRLADAVPALLARCRELAHPLAHGDATPDNLREPGDGTIVVIDWSYAGGGALGSDLSQLLAGRVERGAPGTPGLEAIAEAVRAGFAEGLSAAGTEASTSDIELAFATHLAVRSVFSAVNVDHRPDLGGDELADLVARRAELARFGLDTVFAVI